MSALDELGLQLRRRFVAPNSSTTLAQTEPALLARLNAVRQALAPPRGRFAEARIAQGVMAFRISGRNIAYPALKYACYGVARPMDWEGRILLAEAPQLALLLACVRALDSRPGRLAACCRALRRAWALDIEAQPEVLNAAHLRPGIATLRGFLQEMGEQSRPESPATK